ncbi:MAG: DUF308 domain-containing protein [Bacteroidota bacterium]
MATKKFSNWWFLAVNGLIFTLFGILLLLLTQEAIKALLLYIGIGMFVVGGILLIAGIYNIRRNKSAAMILIEAIASIAIGIALVFFPQSSVALFLILTGIWAIIIGVIQLVIVVNVKETISSKNILLLNGLLTIGLGISLLFNPFQWALFLIKIIGVLAAVFGILLVYFAFALRSLKSES